VIFSGGPKVNTKLTQKEYSTVLFVPFASEHILYTGSYLELHVPADYTLKNQTRWKRIEKDGKRARKTSWKLRERNRDCSLHFKTRSICI
jgi:hypothetical protein